MSAVRAAAAQPELAAALLCRLIDEYGSNLLLHELPWLGACVSQVRSGNLLREDQIARISRIRAQFGHRFRHPDGRIGCDRDGAA